MLYPLDREYGLKTVVAATYQAVSGAGRSLCDYPDITDNIVPYIDGEEQKSECEPLKIMGELSDGAIVPLRDTIFSIKCCRAPISDGHLAAVFASFEVKPGIDDVLRIWGKQEGFYGILPSAPKRFIHYHSEPNRPQSETAS